MVQHLRLVVEHTEGCEGCEIQPGPGQRSGQQALRRPRITEENSGPKRASPLLESLCSRLVHQDHQEEINQ